MRGELKNLQHELGITFVHVTHTQPEAIALADMVVVMDTGRIDQADSAKEIFNSPKTPYVARFMGGQNVLTGTVENVTASQVRIAHPGGGSFETAPGPVQAERGKPISIAVRRDRIKLRRRAGETTLGVNEISGVVEATEYQGSYVKVTVDVGGDVFVANVSDADYFAEPVNKGDPVTASWAASDVHMLSKLDTGPSGDPYANATH